MPRPPGRTAGCAAGPQDTAAVVVLCFPYLRAAPDSRAEGRYKGNAMPESIFAVDHVSYSYEENGPLAVRDVSLQVPRGAFHAILGQNGSGKSTLAKLMNGLYLPTAGTVWVCGMNTAEEKNIWEIRRRAGMVFQNPDNQLVATVVREDVAFGLENIGVPTAEMPARIDKALSDVGMTEYAQRAPHLLSGGQKQRVAIAGVLAMQPEAIIFDESTAMLDPRGRREVLAAVQKLNREQGITVLWITHFMEEAVSCDRVHIMHQGQIALSGTPREIFADAARLRPFRLDTPPMARLAQRLREAGMPLKEGILTVDEMAEEVERLCR